MKNLFVGNMSFQTTESELTELFKPFGAITRVRVVMDRETGRAAASHSSKCRMTKKPQRQSRPSMERP